MVPILKMRRFSCLLRLSLPPEMGEMAQIFISEIEWLAALKCRGTGLSTSLFLTERRCSANLSDRLTISFKPAICPPLLPTCLPPHPEHLSYISYLKFTSLIILAGRLSPLAVVLLNSYPAF